MPRSTSYIVVGLFALLVPAALAALILPTPSSDTRELLAWGHFFTLSTSKHPPMMQWLGGLTERVFEPTAFWAIFVTQVFNAVGLAYSYATLRLTVDFNRAAVFTLLLASSAYLFAGPLPFALNADILQFPFWAAVIFHALQAARSNKWVHWICLAVASAAAIYTKYTAFVLFASLGIASVLVAEYRAVWLNLRLYLAMAAGALLVAPHVFAVGDSTALGHASRLMITQGGVPDRFFNLWQIAIGVIIWLAPAWIIIGVGFLRQDCLIIPVTDPVARFLRAMCAAAFGLLVVLVVVLGLTYESRYDVAFLSLLVTAAATLVGFDVDRWPAIETRVLRVATAVPFAAFAVTILIYGVFTAHSYMQEPTSEAAARLQAEWSLHYTCGPAYILGDVWSAYGLAIASKPIAIGVPLEVMHDVQWYDPSSVKRLGAIIVYRDAIAAREVAKAFPNVKLTEAKTFTLPMLRTMAHLTLTYSYAFLPPEGCDAPKPT